MDKMHHESCGGNKEARVCAEPSERDVHSAAPFAAHFMLPNRLVPHYLVVASRINGKWYELSFSLGVEPPLRMRFASRYCMS